MRSYGNFHEVWKWKMDKAKKKFAGSFGTKKIEIFQKWGPFHLKKDPLRRKL